MPKNTLYVTGFTRETKAAELAPYFEKFGDLIRLDIPPPRTDDGEKYAFVEYETFADCERALELNGEVLPFSLAEGLVVQVARSDPYTSKRGGFRGRSSYDFPRGRRGGYSGRYYGGGGYGYGRYDYPPIDNRGYYSRGRYGYSSRGRYGRGRYGRVDNGMRDYRSEVGYSRAQSHRYADEGYEDIYHAETGPLNREHKIHSSQESRTYSPSRSPPQRYSPRHSSPGSPQIRDRSRSPRHD